VARELGYGRAGSQIQAAFKKAVTRLVKARRIARAGDRLEPAAARDSRGRFVAAPAGPKDQPEPAGKGRRRTTTKAAGDPATAGKRRGGRRQPAG
jgi:hypothetical protein